MKKSVVFIAACMLASSVFTSCKKSYTCECVNTFGERTTHNIIATNRTEGQKNCDEKGLIGHCKLK